MSIVAALSSLALLAAAQPVGPIETDGQTIAISGADHTETLPCEGRDVSVVGTGHAITLTGVCKSLEVMGVDNAVTAAIAPGGRLSVTGTGHKVRWRSTGEVRRSVSGVDNQVTKVK